VIVGGYGARWVKNGAELLGGIYRLDRFHLKKALHRVMDNGLALEVCQACIKGGIDRVDRILTQVQQRATGVVFGGEGQDETKITDKNLPGQYTRSKLHCRMIRLL